MIDKSIIEQIKLKNDIVEVVSNYIDLSKKGKNYWALCPFHEDSNPSMSVSPEKQMYKCFVCQAGGSCINFVSDYEKVPFVKALSILGAKVGIEIKYDEKNNAKYNERNNALVELMKDATNFFQYSLSTESGTGALEYLKSRNMDQKIIDKFMIGYAPQKGLLTFLEKKGHDQANIINASLANNKLKPFFRNRLIFALANDYGDVVGYSARTLGNDKSKYINSSESELFNKSLILYNYFNAKDTIKKTKEVFIAEGFIDVIALYKAGIKNAVAIMGTALTYDHTNKLKGIKVNLFLDSDKAGINATIKSIKILLDRGIEVYVIDNKTGLDPDEILNTKGKDELISMTKNKISAYEFIYQTHKIKYDINNPVEIDKLIKSFAKFLEKTNRTIKDFYINKIAADLKVSTESILQYVPEPKHMKPYVITKKNRFIAEERNDAYWLINSIIANNEFAKLMVEHQVNFSDKMLIIIGKYIISRVKKEPTTLTAQMKEKINEIKLYNDIKAPVKTEDEFKDLIKRVNIETKNVIKSKIELKLEHSNNSIEKAKLIEHWIKIHKGDK